MDDTLDIEFLQNLKQRLWHMMQNGEYSDVTFIVEGTEFHCHKNILASSCPYFRTMLQSEITGPETKLIEITTIPKDIFQAMIQFIYTGDINITHENAQQFLEASDLMQFSELMKRCSHFLTDEMDPANCIGIWQAAKIFNAPRLEQMSYEFARDNFSDVVQHEEFLTLDADSLKCYVSDAYLAASSEDFICAQVLKWVDHNPDERFAYLYSILLGLRLYSLSPHFIQYNLVKNPRIISNPELLGFLQDVVNHIIFLAPLPSQLHPGFPRIKTDLANGIVLLSKEYIHSEGKRESKTKLGHYKFTDENKFCLIKPLEMMVNFDGESMVCAMDNWLFVCNNDGMHKYDMPTKQWTLCTPSVNARYKILLGEGKKMFGIEYSNMRCPVSEYVLQENKWGKLGNLRRIINLTDFGIMESRGVIFIFGGNMTIPDGIQVFDTVTNNGYVLKTKMPSILTSIQVKTLHNNAIVAGKEACLIYNLDDLHASVDYCRNLVPSTPTTPQRMEVGPEGEIQAARRSQHLTEAERQQILENAPEINVITKPGIKRENFLLELVGNQLIVLAGTSQPHKFVKEIVATDVNDFVKDGTDVEWRTVGTLTSELSKHNISSYKSCAVTVNQF